jgi:hypothetical protein
MACGVDDMAVTAHVVADEIPGAADRLKAGHVWTASTMMPTISQIVTRSRLAYSAMEPGCQPATQWRQTGAYSAAAASASAARGSAARKAAARASTISTTWSIMASFSIV